VLFMFQKHFLTSVVHKLTYVWLFLSSNFGYKRKFLKMVCSTSIKVLKISELSCFSYLSDKNVPHNGSQWTFNKCLVLAQSVLWLQTHHKNPIYTSHASTTSVGKHFPGPALHGYWLKSQLRKYWNLKSK